MRLAAMGDLHFSKSSRENLQPVFSEIGQKADVLLLCGDLPGAASPGYDEWAYGRSAFGGK